MGGDIPGVGDPIEVEGGSARVIRGGALRMIGYLSATAIGAASFAILLRALGVEDAGRYVPVIALTGIVGGLLEIGMVGVGVREFSTRAGTDRELFFRDLIGLRLLLTGVGIGVGMGIAAALGFDQTMVIGAGISGVAFMLFALQGVLVIPLLSAMRYGWASALDVIRQAGSLVAVACLALAGAGLLPFYAVGIPASMVTVTWVALLVRNQTSLRPAFDLARWRRMVREILPYSVAVSLSVVYPRIGAVVIAVVSTATQAGLYGASFRITEVAAASVPTALVAVMPVLSRVAAEDVLRLQAAMTKLVRTALVLSGLVLVSVWSLAPTIITVIAGPGFDGAIVPLQIQSIMLAVSVIVASMGYGLLAHRQHRALLLSNIVALTCTLALSIPLSASDGAVGTSWALVAGECSLAVSYFIATSMGVRLQVGRTAAAVAVACAAALVPPELLGLASVPATALAVAIFVLVVGATRALPPDVARQLTSLGRRRSR